MQAAPPPFRPPFCRWLRPLFWVAAGLVIFYGLSTIVVLLYLRREGLHGITWRDVALPSRWANVRVARGDHQVGVAHASFRQGRLNEALAYARSGIAKSPTNREGRLLFARLLALNTPPAAEEVLLQGLNYHRADPRYLSAVFSFLDARLADEQATAIARKLIADSALPSPSHFVAGCSGARASFLRGNYDQAEDFLDAVPGLRASHEGRLLAAKIDWDRGYRDLALMELRNRSSNPSANPPLQAEFLRCLRELGLNDEARRATLAFRIAHPDLLVARIDLLRAYRDSGAQVAVVREIEALFHDFPDDATALAAIGDWAANTGDVSLARRAAGHAQRANLPFEPYAFLLLEAYIVARDYQGASAAIDELTRENPTWAHAYRSLLDSLRAVAARGSGDIEASRLYLANFLQQPKLRAANLLALANRFLALDAVELAREVLVRAIHADPLNQAALTRLIELELTLNRVDDLPAHLHRLLAMRKPSPDLLRVAQHKLGSDLFLFSADRLTALDAIATRLEREHPTRFSAQLPAVR